MSAVGSKTVKTNNVPSSVHCIELTPITFEQLWDNYETGTPYVDSKTGDVPKGFKNQCAIRMSVTLHKVGVEMKSFNGNGCILLNGKKTATRAPELAAWLDRKPFCGIDKSINITGENWEDKVENITGIIFFENYWTREGQNHPTGSHIDLWNGDRLTVSSFADGFATWGRYLGVSHADMTWIHENAQWSDLGQSTRILFWEIK
jgi:hypothetical protein